MLIVQKFGGSSVKDAERIRHVARIIAETFLLGHDVVVVLSAQGDTTDELLEKAAELNRNPSKRELDMLLTTGEQQSVALMAMCLESMDLPVTSLNSWQVGLRTDTTYGSARIRRVETERLRRELDQHRIVLVTGFQGVNKFDDYTTLGRGGSDTTAVALAAALRADRCQKILSLFLILFTGVLLVKSKLLSASDSRVLSVLSIYLIMPCVIISAFQVDLTDVVKRGLMLSFGAAIAIHMRFSKIISYRRLWLIAALRLLICPAIILFALKVMKAESFVPHGDKIVMITLLATMAPSASSTTQMAQVYGKDADYAGVINLISTILCIITMPCMVALYQVI